MAFIRGGMDNVLNSEVIRKVMDSCKVDNCEKDNSGQLVFYTGIYRWNDGTLRSVPEFDEEDYPADSCPDSDWCLDDEETI